MPTINDKRKAADVEKLNWVVCGKDSFMSGWGGAKGGRSFAAWACHDDNVDEILAQAESRGDITYITAKKMPANARDIRRLRGNDHLTIYVRN